MAAVVPTVPSRQELNVDNLWSVDSFYGDIGPVTANVTVEVLDIQRIDLHEQTFNATVLVRVISDSLFEQLEAVWDSKPVEEQIVPAEWMLHKRIIITNIVPGSQREDERWVTRSRHAFNYQVNTEFFCPANLADFPFDGFSLPFELRIQKEDKLVVHVEDEAMRCRLRNDAAVRQQFHISHVMTYRVSNTDPEMSATRAVYPLVSVELPVLRRTPNAVFNGILPTLIVTFLAATGGAQPVTDLVNRLALIFSLVIAMLQFKQSLNFNITTSGTNTSLDWLIVLQYFGVAAAAMLSTAGYVRACRPGTLSEALLWLGTLVMPVLCMIVQTLHGFADIVAAAASHAWPDRYPYTAPNLTHPGGLVAWGLPNCARLGLGRPHSSVTQVSALGWRGRWLVQAIDNVTKSLPFSSSAGAGIGWQPNITNLTSNTDLDGNLTCTNDEQATRSDRVMWLILVGVLMLLFIINLGSGIAGRAWALLRPEWAFFELARKPNNAFMVRLRQVAKRVRELAVRKPVGTERARLRVRDKDDRPPLGDCVPDWDGGLAVYEHSKKKKKSRGRPNVLHRVMSIGPGQHPSSSSEDHNDAGEDDDGDGNDDDGTNPPDARTPTNLQHLEPISSASSSTSGLGRRPSHRAPEEQEAEAQERVFGSGRDEMWRARRLRHNQRGQFCCCVDFRCCSHEIGILGHVATLLRLPFACLYSLADVEQRINNAAAALNLFRSVFALRFSKQDLLRLEEAVDEHERSGGFFTESTFDQRELDRRAWLQAGLRQLARLARALGVHAQWLEEHRRIVVVDGTPVCPPHSREHTAYFGDVCWLLFHYKPDDGQDDKKDDIDDGQDDKKDDVDDGSNGAVPRSNSRGRPSTTPNSTGTDSRGLGRRISFADQSESTDGKEQEDEDEDEEEEDEEEEDEEEEEEEEEDARPVLRTRSSSNMRRRTTSRRHR